MSNFYYETVSKLEQQSTDKNYVLGWVSGFLGNPKIEEQRITEAWEAGYEDGQSKTTDSASNWKAA